MWLGLDWRETEECRVIGRSARCVSGAEGRGPKILAIGIDD